MHMMKSRRTMGMSSIYLAIAFAWPTWVLAQQSVTTTQSATAPAVVDPSAVLKRIPANATAFVAIRNLQELDTDITAIAAKLGFPLGPAGMFPAPLDLLKENTGIDAGLNPNASLAFVVLDCKQVKTAAMLLMRLAILIPTDDPKALAASLGAQDMGGVLQVNLMGMPSFAAPTEGFLVLAQMPTILQEVVQAKGGGVITAMAKDRVEAFASNDLFVWANFRGISTELQAQIAAALHGLMMKANPTAPMNANPLGTQTTTTTGDTGATEMVQQVNEFFEQAQEASLGIALNARKGIQFTAYGRMKAGTELAKAWSAIRPIGDSALLGLPNEPTVLAIGAGGGMTQVRDFVSEAIEKLAAQEKPDSIIKIADLRPLLDTYFDMTTAIEQISFGLSGLPVDEEGHGLIGLTVVAKVTESKTWCGNVHKLIAIAKDLLVKAGKAQGADEEEIQAVADAIQIKKGAETLAGTTVDHLSVKIANLPDVEPTDVAEIESVTGKSGILFRFAPVGQKYVVMTLGGGPKRFTQIAGHAAKGEAPLAKHADIKKVAKYLTQGKRVAEAYVNLDHLMSLIVAVANTMEYPLPPLTMQNAAPIVYTQTRVDDGAQQFDLLVPMDLVLSVNNAVKTVLPIIMMGGMGGDMPQSPGQPTPLPSGGGLN